MHMALVGLKLKKKTLYLSMLDIIENKHSTFNIFNTF